MKSKVLMLVLAACAIACAGEKKVYRIELEDEKPVIVGEDGVRREVVIMDTETHMMMTGRLDQVWKTMNETKAGRERIHGKVVETRIDEEAKEKVEVYKDGFVHTEKMEKKNKNTMKSFVGAGKRGKVPRKRFSARQSEMQRKLDEWKAKKPKTVTVEHDAVTGKDKLVK